MKFVNTVMIFAGTAMVFGGIFIGVLILPHVPRLERSHRFPSARTSSDARAEGSYQDVVGNIDVVKLANVIKWNESRGNYNARGRDGEIGAYQIMPRYWPHFSRETFGEVRPPTPENQDAVARSRIAKFARQGYSVREIAMLWNGGSTRPKRGISPGGVPYDTSLYGEKILRLYLNA